MFGKPATEVVSFKYLELHSSMLYHLIYHFSCAIHVNHLFFLNSYLFGVFLMVSSVGFWQAVAAVLLLYGSYMVKLFAGHGVLYALPYMSFVAGIGVGAWFLSENLLFPLMNRSEIALIGFGIVMGSFSVQLFGHARYEEFSAPPDLFHGFVAAPVLEYVSSLFHSGAMADKYTELMGEVVAVRNRARDAHSIEGRHDISNAMWTSLLIAEKN
eukprot:TRINITY_DN73678_c0_g1_i1.p1 TRINITY_DN73678_c0_g1~~TRINITY_DN73678_c0_g1_i1.p1  ORF type:complete len:213 (+),score=35.09 TRINITY_DN73678_c0_g1_i1:67-705(+)